MDELREYLNSLSLVEQVSFAERCGTTIAYLRKAISKRQEFGAKLSVSIEKESGGIVNRKLLHPNDWESMWPELCAA